MSQTGLFQVLREGEWRAARPAIDLAVGEPVHTAVELKFPREPHEENAAWTQTLGELLKDFFRLAQLPASVSDRWCVQVVSGRLRRYLDGIQTKSRTTPGDDGR